MRYSPTANGNVDDDMLVVMFIILLLFVEFFLEYTRSNSDSMCCSRMTESTFPMMIDVGG